MRLQQPSASSLKERYNHGKKLREATPRETLGEWAPAKDRPDPLKTLATVNPGRIPALLPIKAQRMSASPFAFFRGAAVLMTSDLAASGVSGLTAQLCDAHVRNLGAYADPDGRLIFDLNDFDETIPGPWEWDVKRLATSLVLAGDEAGETPANCVAAVRAFVAAYRKAMSMFAEMPVVGLARYRVSRHREDPVLAGIFEKAQRVTPQRNLKKLTIRTAGGKYRFHDEPPLLRHVPAARTQEVIESLAEYRETLGAGRRMVLDEYKPADVAFKLVGTGSVGTRDYVTLLFGNGLEDPLFIQIKQELPSCHAPYLPDAPESDHQGRRVCEGQQRMQTAYDPLLGYTRIAGEDYLVRQLADHKAALDPADLSGKVCSGYAALCGEVLAKGHARTGDAAALAGYCGKTVKLDDAIAKFAVTYAAQTKADYRVFMKSFRQKKAAGKGKWGKGVMEWWSNGHRGAHGARTARLATPRTIPHGPLPFPNCARGDFSFSSRASFLQSPTPSTGILRTNLSHPMPSSHLSRRRFLTQTAGVAAATVLGPNLLLRGQNTAGRRLNIAVIGASGKGQVDTSKVALDHNIVALVDVDSTRLASAAKSLEKKYVDVGDTTRQAPRLYADFRKMFEEMANGIDAVIVSTPDHTHYVAAMWALRHKKHVAVQKPLCNSIWEIRDLHRAAKEAGVMSQMGNQGRTMEGQRFAKEWIDQGAIGTLQEIRLWTNRPIWPQGPLKKVAAEKPANLDWDLWLSVEPTEPYFEFEVPSNQPQPKRGKSVAPFNWRGWWQFGSGALGDMGCHIMDASFSILGQAIPEKIEVESSPISDLNAPVWTRLRYHFAATDKHPALVVSWHDGLGDDGKPNKPERDPRVPQEAFDKATSGMMFIGTDGVVFEPDAYCEHPVIFPEERFADVKKEMVGGKIKQTEKRSPMPDNPQGEWAHYIVHPDKGVPSSNFDYAAPLAEFVSLGNLAIRSKEAIQWDAKAGKVTNVEAANRFVKRASYRSGWI